MSDRNINPYPTPARAGFSMASLSSPVSRRTLLRSAMGVGAAAALAACGGDKVGGASSTTGAQPTGSGGAAAASGTVTFGSNYSDAVPKAAMQSVFDGFKTDTGIDVKVNTVDHNTFQEQINSYLQGTPDDVFTWFAGYRMQFFAQKNLASPIDDVWSTIGSHFNDAFKQASTGLDGKAYFVPFYYYPWAIFYRKSVFQEHGYQVPKTLDEFETLCKKMQQDKLVPIAFADKDGWPAMGTFDALNCRVNGYDFHMKLMRGEASWDSKECRDVFSTWAALLPYHQSGALGRTWQDAAQSLVKKQAGMYLLGMFVGQQFSDADRGDLDFFPFPEINSQYGQDTLDAPIDGFMVSANPKNMAAAKKLMEYLGTAKAEGIYLKADPNNVGAANDTDTSGYNALQKKAAELVGGAKHITQFLDRDTRPDFASTVMIPSLQSFLNNPKDIDGLVKQIEAQKKSIFAS